MPFAIAMGSLMFSVANAIGIYWLAKKWLGLPMLLNLPGALIAFLHAVALTGWLSSISGVMDDVIGPRFPQVPWHTWVIYGIVGVLWYALMGSIVRWRRAAKQAPTARGVLHSVDASDRRAS